MKQVENNTETYGVYLEMFDLCSIKCSVNVNAILECFPCTPRIPWHVELALEDFVASKIGTPDLTHVPVGGSRME
jgi:hypothetical protein